jgi:hypothetical protein
MRSRSRVDDVTEAPVRAVESRTGEAMGDRKERTFEPVTAEAMRADAGTRGWAETVARVPEGATYWLATVGPGGRAHLVPLLAVWVDGVLHFAAGETTRKARNVMRDARCALGVNAAGVDLVVEGEAVKVRDETVLRRVADAYASRYKWHVTVRDGAFHDEEGAPSAGPPPYDVYRLVPTRAYGLGTTNEPRPTRWRF